MIAIANQAKATQTALQKSVHKLALDTLFLPELEKTSEERKAFRGTIMGLRESRLYVELDTPPVELKVYTQDMTEPKEQFYIEDGVRLASSQHCFRLGDGVNIRVLGYDECGVDGVSSSSRWTRCVSTNPCFDSPTQQAKTHLKLESNQNDEMSTLVRISSCFQRAPLKKTMPAQTERELNRSSFPSEYCD